mmetsp:Transcript_63168/g.112275  ORF Transcript_63168/g.112275 Transcript_63168/m.112275 type:complete len:243 (-) Transcript_63168:142-870(-)
MLFYVFGIIFTMGVVNTLDSTQKRKDTSNAEVIEYFGSLDKSIIALFMSMSGGNDWGQYFDALKQLDAVYPALYIAFILFAIFAVFNIVTGVFVESAMQSTQADRETVVQDELEAKKVYLENMKTLFEEMDDDDSGKITLEEFTSRLGDARVAAYFNSLKLDVTDAVMLFKLIDDDGSDEISYEEFVDGCSKLQGEARSLDAKIMQFEVRQVKRDMEKLLAVVKESQSSSSIFPNSASRPMT